MTNQQLLTKKVDFEEFEFENFQHLNHRRGTWVLNINVLT